MPEGHLYPFLPPTWVSWQGGADTAWDLIAPAACELLDDAEVCPADQPAA